MKRINAILLGLLLFFGAFTSIFAASNEWMIVQLYWGSSEVVNAGSYRVDILTQTLPNQPATLDYADMSVNVYPDTTYGLLQFGKAVDSSGTKWFVYSPDHLPTCMRGNIIWGGEGCMGNYNDIVAYNTWNWFQMNYGLESCSPTCIYKWYVFAWSADENTAYLLAKLGSFTSPTPVISGPHVEMEEATSLSYEP